jgi:hydroxymethylpyrimidine kinase/phosphomethylpyrimidine kinase/thiamine-phosphate diphosphorylase
MPISSITSAATGAETHPQPPIVWTVSGSDSGGGAGLQADLRALDAMNVHGCSAVAALTAQNSQAVTRIEPVGHDMLGAQLAALAADLPPAAIKTGMLGSVANLQVLVRWVDRLRDTHPALALVVDPVLRASTGAGFANEALLQAYRQDLLPRATLITPNRAEAALLLGCAPLQSRADVEQAARALLALGGQAVVITGGDNAEGTSDDYAATPHANGWLSLPRVATAHHHGTGCVFASSAAAALARGFVSIEAIILAKMATTHALRHSYAAGQGAGPVRPRADFAQHSVNLPTFSLPSFNPPAFSLPGATITPTPLTFAPLSDPALGLYAVVDSAAWVQRVLAAGVRTVQLRVKDPLAPQLRDEVRQSVAAARSAGAQLFINDHWQIAIEEGAYGVHLGQEDLAVADLGAIAQAGLRLGISTHAYWEVCRAWGLRPSYIACGPIHATRSKDMPWTPQGNGNLAYWAELLQRSGGVPVVGIAGMDAARMVEAGQCGVASAAVITAITAAPSPESAISALQQAFAQGHASTRWQVPVLPQSTLASLV